MTLSIHELRFAYRETETLHNISLEADDGEMVSLLGPNGSGKTTLLKCIAGLHQPSEGTIEIDGHRAVKLPMKEMARLVGYVPQDTGSSFAISVLNAVLLGRTPYIRFGASNEDLNISQEAIERMGLRPLAFRMLNELSGGERQRVLIARALAQQPKVLLLDEPTSSLDLKYQLETLEIVRRVAREKRLLVLLSIHDLNLASRFSDRLLMLKDGYLLADGTSAQVLTMENIQELYGVEAIVCREEGFTFVFPMQVTSEKETS